MDNQKKFEMAFSRVKEMGFVKSNRTGNTGIGKTLEDIMGIQENNIDAPDLHGFEIKSQRNLSGSYVTLFTRAPSHPKAVNNILRVEYGSYDEVFTDVKVLHTSVFSHRWNTHKSGYSYRLELDNINQKLLLLIKDMSTDKIVRSDVHWDYSVLDKIMNEKLQYLAFVQAHCKNIDGFEHFKFDQCSFYYGVSLDAFLRNVESGNIMFDIRIGAYKNIEKKTYGKTHDHGSGFRIKKTSMNDLYDNFISI
jgi:hypothetical protein